MTKIILASLLISLGAVAAEVTEKDFDNDVKSAKGVVLVVFSRPGCMSCDAFAGEIPKIESGLGEKVMVMDMSQNPGARESHQIKKVPTTVVFRDGNEVGRIEGSGNHRDVIPKLRSIILKTDK